MKKIVAIGGGTGLSQILPGLKRMDCEVTAIVTVTDEGGSSGHLRREYGMIPPGDIRQCLIALAEREDELARVFRYRFRGKGALAGHSFGNLFLKVLSDIAGGFDAGVLLAGRILATRGRVLPASLENIRLKAHLAGGGTLLGERRISSRSNGKICPAILRMVLLPSRPRPFGECLKALQSARAIVVGPGSLYTSLITNLLVPGILRAIRNSRARKIYVCNIMTQAAETQGYSVEDHLRAISQHARGLEFDKIIVNTSIPSAKILARYGRQGAHPVTLSGEISPKNLVTADLVSREEYARHDPEKLTRLLWRLI